VTTDWTREQHGDRDNGNTAVAPQSTVVTVHAFSMNYCINGGDRDKGNGNTMVTEQSACRVDML